MIKLRGGIIMPDVEGTEYLVFEEFKNTVIDMLNALGTNHIRIRLSDGGELDIDYTPKEVEIEL